MNMPSVLHVSITTISVFLAPLVTGCARHKVYEIDVTPVENFAWSGRVRITERHTDYYRLFAPTEHRTEIARIELLGAQNRNLVIHPADLTCENSNKPNAAAWMQEYGVPPDVYLVRMREEFPEFERAWRSMLAYDSQFHILTNASDKRATKAVLTTEETRAVADAFQRDFQIALSRFGQLENHVDSQQFDQISGLELAFVAAFKAKQTEATYDLNERQIARVRIDDGNLLTVTVEDRDGSLVHCYCPEELKILENPER